MNFLELVHQERTARILCQSPKLLGPREGPRVRVECDLPLGHAEDHHYPEPPPFPSKDEDTLVSPIRTRGELASCKGPPSKDAVSDFRDELLALARSAEALPALHALARALPLAEGGALLQENVYTVWILATRALLQTLGAPYDPTTHSYRLP